MVAKNRYYKRSRIAEKKFRQIIRYFYLDISASDIARLTEISVRSINDIYIKIRHRLAEECENNSAFSGQIEVDESYFGPKRVRGKRGRGAGNKTIVFGLLKRDGYVYTEIIPSARKATLQGIIRGKVEFGECYPFGWLERLSWFSRFRVRETFSCHTQRE